MKGDYDYDHMIDLKALTRPIILYTKNCPCALFQERFYLEPDLFVMKV